MRLALVIAIAFVVAARCYGHSGRTDSSGGHHDRRNGGYHYHGGGPARSTSYTPIARVAAPSPRRTEVRTAVKDRVAETRAATVPTVSPSGVLGRESSTVAQVEPAPDPAVLKAEADAQVILDRALANETAKEYDKAVRDLLQVLRKWPMTPAAKKARDELARLRANEPLRTWQSKNGKHSVVARFVREQDGRVVLQTEAGKPSGIAFDDLSSKDRVYVIMRRRPL